MVTRTEVAEELLRIVLDGNPGFLKFGIDPAELKREQNAARPMKTANWTRGWTNTTVRPAGGDTVASLHRKTESP